MFRLLDKTGSSNFGLNYCLAVPGAEVWTSSTPGCLNFLLTADNSLHGHSILCPSASSGGCFWTLKGTFSLDHWSYLHFLFYHWWHESCYYYRCLSGVWEPFWKDSILFISTLKKEMLCINYDTVLRSMEETIIFNVITSHKTENIHSISCFVCYSFKEW